MTQVTLVGNATSDAELRFTQSGLPVASFSLAVNDRRFDRDTNTWVDGEPSFYRVSAWRQLGENAAASITKGQQVVVVGKMAIKSFQDKDEQTRQSVEVTAEEIGIGIKFGTTVFTKSAPRQQQGAPQAGGYPQTPQGYPQPAPQGWPPQGNYGTVPSYAGGSPTPQPSQLPPPRTPQPPQGLWGQPPQDAWAQPQGPAAYNNEEPF